jgi:tetratricopeptide (TPR) repeat protein
LSQTLADVKNGTVRIEDANGKFYGTAFFVQKEYCITCHHNIYRIQDQIYVVKGRQRHKAEWIPEYSDAEMDIAILRVKGINATILNIAGDIFENLDVVIWGYPRSTEGNLIGGESRKGELGEDTEYGEKEEKVHGDKPWCKKSPFMVNVYECRSLDDGKFEEGLSGSPVCEKKSNKVVAMFEAIKAGNEHLGYVIPIRKGLEKLQSSKVAVAPYNIKVADLMRQGNAYFMKKNFAKAIEFYDKVIKDPGYAWALYNKGTDLSQLGKPAEAIEYYDKALAINPNYADAWDNKGSALANLGKPAEAIEYYDKALAINPNDPIAWYNKGTALKVLGRHEEAQVCFNKAKQLGLI